MDIYKLSDEVPMEKNRARGKSGFDAMSGEVRGDDVKSGKLVITDLRQGVKNLNRVNVFINSEFLFSLDIAQVVDYKIKVGKELSEEECTRLKNASEFGKLYQRALEWVLIRPRSIKETEDYLFRKIYEKKLDKESIDRIIEKLKEKKYLDDLRFAEWYVENRFVKKGVSRKRLSVELMKKGIAKETVSEVLDGRDDEEEIRKIIARKRARYDDEKLINYLVRQGFSYELVQSLVRETD